MKKFRDDLVKLLDKLKAKKPFAFSKYADGEYGIMKGQTIGNKEFWYNAGSGEPYRKKLVESFQYKHPDYIVGIGCPCCMGQESFEDMKKLSGQDESNLTWANIFVNDNYKFYEKELIKEYGNHEVIMVVNENADIDSLPFDVKKAFRVGHTAWVNNYNTVDEIKKYIDDEGIKNHLFLFCAGPFGNILSHQLHDHNKENIYFDIGSTLDPLMGLGGTRGYHRGAGTVNKVCVWG